MISSLISPPHILYWIEYFFFFSIPSLRGVVLINSSSISNLMEVTTDDNPSIDMYNADITAAENRMVNEIDPFVSKTIDMALIKGAFYDVGELQASSTNYRFKALRAYFEGVAAAGHHENAVNSIKCMKTLLDVRTITEEKHPVKGYLGVFARENIPADTVLGIYGGLITSSAQADMEHRQKKDCKRSPVDKDRGCKFYIWKIPMRKKTVAALDNKKAKEELLKLAYNGTRNNVSSEIGLEVLGTHYGNVLRFINGFQGIARHDNVVPIAVWWNGAPRIVYMTRYRIRKNEELLVNYGSEFKFDAKSLSESVSDVEDPEGHEYEVKVVLRAKKRRLPDRDGNTLKFLILWEDGKRTWKRVRDLVEVDTSVPSDPYIYNASFHAFLKSDGFSAFLKANKMTHKAIILPRAAALEASENESGDEADDQDPEENDPDSEAEDRDVSIHSSYSEDGDSIVDPDVSTEGVAIIAQIVPDKSSEKSVTSVDDMNYMGKTQGYEFHVLWGDGTTSWVRMEDLVDMEEADSLNYVYTSALVRFLKKTGINESDFVPMIRGEVVYTTQKTPKKVAKKNAKNAIIAGSVDAKPVDVITNVTPTKVRKTKSKAPVKKPLAHDDNAPPTQM
jgi:hypothetical protein